MPWSDNSGNKGSSGGPWGQSPRPSGPQNGRGGAEPPDLEDLLKASQQRLKRVFPGGRNGGRGGDSLKFNRNTALTAVAALFGLWVMTGVYQVQLNELGVVTTFGKFDHVAGPGLHWRLPYPFQSTRKALVTSVRTSQLPNPDSGAGLMLTRDKNVVDAAMTVQWVVKPDLVPAAPGEMPGVAEFVFNIDDPENLVAAVAEASLREVVGRNDLDFIQTTGRTKIQNDTRALLQAALDRYKSGVEIREVNLGKVAPPNDEVNAAFLDVLAAKQDRDAAVNTARAYENKVVTEAVGEARQRVEQAKAYAAQTTAEARGQAARFNDIYEEYQHAPEVTRQRLYLETMERVLGPMNKVLVDGQGGRGALPYLPLNDLPKPRGKAPAAPQSGDHQ